MLEVLLFFLTTSLHATIPCNGCEAQYFTNASDPCADASGNNRTGIDCGSIPLGTGCTRQGAGNWGPSQNTTGFYLKGPAALITAINNKTDYSIGSYVYPFSVSGDMTIITLGNAANNQTGLQIQAGGKFLAYIGGTGVTITSSILFVPNHCYYVAMTNSGTTGKSFWVSEDTGSRLNQTPVLSDVNATGLGTILFIQLQRKLDTGGGEGGLYMNDVTIWTQALYSIPFDGIVTSSGDDCMGFKTLSGLPCD